MVVALDCTDYSSSRCCFYRSYNYSYHFVLGSCHVFGSYPASGSYPTYGSYPAFDNYPAFGSYPALGNNYCTFLNLNITFLHCKGLPLY